MIISVVSIRDEVSDLFGTPVFFNNLPEAERYFVWLCQDKDNPVGRFKDHHHLYFVGDFDTDTGVMSADDHPRLIMSGVNVQIEESK